MTSKGGSDAELARMYRRIQAQRIMDEYGRANGKEPETPEQVEAWVKSLTKNQHDELDRRINPGK
jgi:hypothetical protein